MKSFPNCHLLIANATKNVDNYYIMYGIKISIGIVGYVRILKEYRFFLCTYGALSNNILNKLLVTMLQLCAAMMS